MVWKVSEAMNFPSGLRDLSCKEAARLMSFRRDRELSASEQEFFTFLNQFLNRFHILIVSPVNPHVLQQTQRRHCDQHKRAAVT